ncbi:glycoside hydrolase family 26 protein [Nakamurella deserti]|uniref:glycoside hydrolase family 26 protein n=1 Tax=Nakamurella deserti TaxID=2164074 RepID=UPI00197B71CF|nr:glycosyl hydrolase [Nakamurella deserti]
MSSVALSPRRAVAFLIVLIALSATAVLSGSQSATASPQRPGDLAAPSPLAFGVSTWGGPLDTAGMAEVARLAGETPTLELFYEDFEQPVPLAKLDAVRSRGATPVITWEPWQWGGGPVQPAYALDRIADGTYDAHIADWARGLQAWGHPLTLRFAHEMNGDWYPWAAGVSGNTAADYVAAWRHVHDLFTAADATNVTWLWSPNTPYDGSAPMADFYPGAAYVDTVGLDGYNWGGTTAWNPWIEPRALFANGLTQLRALAPGKPILIAETGSADAGGDKARWIGRLVRYLDAQPDVTGFVWFDHVKETDWRFHSTPRTTAAFAAALDRRVAG